jgi:hypothetical protein
MHGLRLAARAAFPWDGPAGKLLWFTVSVIEKTGF